MGAQQGSSSTVPLLDTKLCVPRPRRNVIRRPRLDSRLTVAELPALTVVSAPAGFGKTTLLTSWLAESHVADMSAAWISLDTADNDPGRAFAGTVESVGRK